MDEISWQTAELLPGQRLSCAAEWTAALTNIRTDLKSASLSGTWGNTSKWLLNNFRSRAPTVNQTAALTCRALSRGWWCSGRWKVRCSRWFGFRTTSRWRCGSGSVRLPGCAGSGHGFSTPRRVDIRESWRRFKLERSFELKSRELFTHGGTLILNYTNDETLNDDFRKHSCDRNITVWRQKSSNHPDSLIFYQIWRVISSFWIFSQWLAVCCARSSFTPLTNRTGAVLSVTMEACVDWQAYWPIRWTDSGGLCFLPHSP